MNQASDVNQDEDHTVHVTPAFEHVWIAVAYDRPELDYYNTVDYCKRCGSNRKYLEREKIPCQIVEIGLR